LVGGGFAGGGWRGGGLFSGVWFWGSDCVCVGVGVFLCVGGFGLGGVGFAVARGLCDFFCGLGRLLGGSSSQSLTSGQGGKGTFA